MIIIRLKILKLLAVLAFLLALIKMVILKAILILRLRIVILIFLICIFILFFIFYILNCVLLNASLLIHLLGLVQRLLNWKLIFHLGSNCLTVFIVIDSIKGLPFTGRLIILSAKASFIDTISLLRCMLLLMRSLRDREIVHRLIVRCDFIILLRLRSTTAATV